MLAVILVAIGVGYWWTTNANIRPVDGISCDSGLHAGGYRAHLDMLYGLQPVLLPSDIGGRPTCSYWLQTTSSDGLVQVAPPAAARGRTFTLGDFFDVWGQPLGRTQMATLRPRSGQTLRAWVDGKEYTGDPRSIPLRPTATIVLQVGPPFQDPPPTFDWNSVNPGPTPTPTP